MYGFRQWSDGGGLMSYGSIIYDLGYRGAAYVDKLFRGARPADLPVEQPTKFELVINLKTAKALGLTIPPWLLLRAEHVIERLPTAPQGSRSSTRRRGALRAGRGWCIRLQTLQTPRASSTLPPCPRPLRLVRPAGA